MIKDNQSIVSFEENHGGVWNEWVEPSRVEGHHDQQQRRQTAYPGLSMTSGQQWVLSDRLVHIMDLGFAESS